MHPASTSYVFNLEMQLRSALPSCLRPLCVVVYIQIPCADACTDDDDSTRKFNTGTLFDLIVCSAASIEHVVSLQSGRSSGSFAAAMAMPTDVCYLDPTVTAMLPIQTCRRRIQRNSRSSINNSPGAFCASALCVVWYLEDTAGCDHA